MTNSGEYQNQQSTSNIGKKTWRPQHNKGKTRHCKSTVKIFSLTLDNNW